MSTYLTIDVLDQVTHNMRESIAQSFDRHGERQDSPTGRIFWDDFADQAIPVRSFEWFAPGRTAIAALRSFLDARKGRVVPFWVPTFCRELVMSVDATSVQSSIRVYRHGYGQNLFPYNARKHTAIVSPDGSFLRRKVTLITDNGDGTESLSLDSGLGINLSAAVTMVSFLTLCRLEEDNAPIRWFGGAHAEASLRFREVPLEVPA